MAPQSSLTWSLRSVALPRQRSLTDLSRLWIWPPGKAEGRRYTSRGIRIRLQGQSCHSKDNPRRLQSLWAVLSSLNYTDLDVYNRSPFQSLPQPRPFPKEYLLNTNRPCGWRETSSFHPPAELCDVGIIVLTALWWRHWFLRRVEVDRGQMSNSCQTQGWTLVARRQRRSFRLGSYWLSGLLGTHWLLLARPVWRWSLFTISVISRTRTDSRLHQQLQLPVRHAPLWLLPCI